LSISVNHESQDVIAFAEQIISLLDEASYTTTYKLAVLIGLMDLVVEQASKDGTLANTITTDQLSEKVIENYWYQVIDYVPLGGLPQQGSSGQAEIVSSIADFRARTNFTSLFSAKIQYQKEYVRLRNKVEKKLIEMPLPRVQYFGRKEQRFIYDIAWSKDQPALMPDVTRYQHGDKSAFDNRIVLKANVANYMVSLNGLLRPLIQRTWVSQVSRMNRLEESKLHDFLFGRDRQIIHQFAPELSSLQQNNCFYCDEKFRTSTNFKPEVDHFIPWARYPNDGLANFVLAHAGCNASKSDHFAAMPHLDKWMIRNMAPSILEELDRIAVDFRWDVRASSSMNIASALYQRLPDNVELWLSKEEFVLKG